jgi:PEP-CTERM motif
MKKFPQIAALTLIGGLALPIYGQAFVNLDFESGQVVAGTGQFGPGIAAANALPAWIVFYQNQPQTDIGYNSSAGIDFYAADVSAFSGQDVTLSFFTALRPEPIAEPNWCLDDIGFSPLPVPEPGTFGLISFGAVMAGFQWWRKLKSSS